MVEYSWNMKSDDWENIEESLSAHIKNNMIEDGQLCKNKTVSVKIDMQLPAENLIGSIQCCEAHTHTVQVSNRTYTISPIKRDDHIR